jgi:mycofactocin precursor
MSQSEPGARDESEPTEADVPAEAADRVDDEAGAGREAREAESGDEPDIEEDLFEEELRIDGICGVY